jgi:hypothetical protein
VRRASCIALLALAGCAAAPAKPTTPTPDAAAGKARIHVERGTDLASAGHAEAPDGKALPLGVIRAPFTFDQRVPVEPAELDLESLPIYELPEALTSAKAPTSMPPSLGVPKLRVDSINSGWHSYGGYDSAVYVVLEAKLGRLQIGSIAENQNASDRVYRTCGEKVYSSPLLAPARWETIERAEGGAVEYHIVDAWFDAMSCLASIMRETRLAPKPLLGGLMMAYRTRCDTCAVREQVVFIAPALTQIGTAGLGGPAVASHGSFSVVKLPLRRGGAASFSGMVMAHSLRPWLDATGGKLPEVPSKVVAQPSSTQPPVQNMTDVHMGIEIQHAVVDEEPQAIAYATLLSR